MNLKTAKQLRRISRRGQTDLPSAAYSGLVVTWFDKDTFENVEHARYGGVYEDHRTKLPRLAPVVLIACQRRRYKALKRMVARRAA